ncbi:MAG: glyoxalase [Bacteroidota bacterium]
MQQAKSLRSFIGAKDFEQSRAFYRTLGFEETPVGEKLSLFKVNEESMFHLQDYYVKEWVENSMLFLEVEDVEALAAAWKSKNLEGQFPGARLSEVKEEAWGKVFYLHDPAGILWHVAAFIG